MRRILFGAAALTASRLLAFFPVRRTIYAPPSDITVVACCSDNRFGMEADIKKRFGLQEEKCLSLVWLGGPNIVLHGSRHEKRFVKKQFQTAVHEKGCRQAIIATHEQCLALELLGITNPKQGREDAPKLSRKLNRIAPQLKCTFLYYPFEPGSRVVAEPECIELGLQTHQQAQEPVMAQR